MLLSQENRSQTDRLCVTQHPDGQHETVVLQPQSCHQVQNLYFNTIIYDTKYTSFVQPLSTDIILLQDNNDMVVYQLVLTFTHIQCYNTAGGSYI